MKSKHKSPAKAELSQKEQFIEFAAISVGVLLLLACAIKVLFL